MESGFLLIDKPKNITSHGVVNQLRRITGIRKIGHAGTLDPFATGLLIIAVGRQATKHIQQFVGMDKDYEADFVLGATTESLDPETPVIKNSAPFSADLPTLERAANALTGPIEQIPPMYSAIKVNGKKLYELARKGVEIERKPRPITIHRFEITGTPTIQEDLTVVPALIACSSGTYIRSLARDFAEKLQTTGYVAELRRTKIGNFTLDEAQKLADITKENWLTFLKTPDEMGIDAS